MIESRVGIDEFGPIASHYDELMDSVPYRMWVGYFLLLLSKLECHPKTMLDVCCGTGTMAELLQDEGFEVEGFDLSRPMIEMARSKSATRIRPIRYEVFDACDFDMGRTFEAAFSFFDSLNYIVDPSRLATALTRIANHVKPGGAFVFDLNTQYAFEQQMFTQKRLQKNARVRYDWKGDWNEKTRLITVDMTFWIGEEQRTERHVQRAYSDFEIRQMLDEAGFDSVECFHAYTLERPREKSDRLHYACKRKTR